MARPRRLVDVLAVITVCATVLVVPA
ncbi:MAG: hypothetical protein QG622_2939, partial [Actinomycetota bacterium]|nr:hypothetical protein [Actinomycetota bacterium]